jgi:hypothetical protein
MIARTIMHAESACRHAGDAADTIPDGPGSSTSE